MNILPSEVIELIAKQDNSTWLILVRTFKFLGTKSLNKNYSNDLKNKFIRKKENYNNFKISYHLPNGKYHRDNDLPAIIFSDGRQDWYQHGNYHRDNDLPAIICSNGTQEWYQNDQLHRDNDKLAIISSDGRQYWYKWSILQIIIN